MGVDNKPVAVDTHSIKQTAEDFPILKKKPQSSPNSLSSNLQELSQVKREQMEGVPQDEIDSALLVPAFSDS